MSKFIDLTGKKINKITVLSVHSKNKIGKTLWNCICECGVIKIINGEYIKNGDAKSCGCLKKEKRGVRNISEFRIWCKMRARCCDKNNKNYGGIGISVCERWRGKNGFLNFINDMGQRPSSNHSIDRIDVNGDYCKENCRWATAKQQQNNRRNNKIVRYNGKDWRMTEICEHFNIDYDLFRLRIRRGWDVERALNINYG